jgi:AAA domain
VSGFQIKDSLAVQFSKAPAIAIAGPTSSGKTESAMRLARGFCGRDKFVLCDTEEKRALYKKARYQPWDWIDFQPPFSPERYVEILEAAKGYKAVIVDSGTHEFQGEGGLHSIQEESLERMSGGDEKRMMALTAPSWATAKMRHKKFMGYLIRYPTLVIVCLRAEPKLKFVKDSNGRMQIVDAGYQPIVERNFMYEMLVACMMTSDAPGVPDHIKKLEPDLEPVFIPGQQIDEGTGQRLAAWCSGRSEPAKPAAPTASIEDLIDEIIDAPDMDALKVRFDAAKVAARNLKDNALMNRIEAAKNERKASLVVDEAL